MMDHLVTENSVTKSFPKQNIWFFVVYTKYKCHIFRILSNLFKAEQDSLRKSSAELLLKKKQKLPNRPVDHTWYYPPFFIFDVRYEVWIERIDMLLYILAKYAEEYI